MKKLYPAERLQSAKPVKVDRRIPALKIEN
jgi:hypothetical protein